MKKLVLIPLLALFTAAAFAQEAKITAAVMDLQAEEGISQGVVRMLSDYLRTQISSTGKFAVVTRENMEMALNGQKFQLAGCASGECVIKAGQILGARKMFAGSLGKIGQTYQVDLKIYDVGSGQIEKAECEICQKCEADALYVSLRNIAYKISGSSEKEGSVPQEARPAEEPRPVPVKITEIITEKDSSVMVLVPAGEFLMGSPEGKGSPDERPQHKVYLDAYYIDKYEVTNRQFAKFLNEWGKDTDEDGQKMIDMSEGDHDRGINKVAVHSDFQPAKGYENCPVTNVTWYGANQYAKWAGKRLPTEAEWEKACLGHQESSGAIYRTTKYCFGDNESDLSEYAWYSANSGGKTHPAGEKKPNQWGIFDMHGNVWEWCSDWYGEDYYAKGISGDKSSPNKNPRGPDSGTFRVFRGGSCGAYAAFCRSADRGWYGPAKWWDFSYGFRCAVSALIP